MCPIERLGWTRLSRTALQERIGSGEVAPHDRVVWETIDPDGRRVVLSFGRSRHIVEQHPELDVPIDVILGAVAQPDHRMPGRKPGQEWFYLGGVGPSRWLRVVVHYERGRGRIVTAFPRRSFP